uniref:Uncharacterized protein n=1 Tax=Xenopus tropicalis TaxID=8364 RepID=A0A1B8XY27_XENTR
MRDSQRWDRLWDFVCERLFNSVPTCEWSNYVNNIGQGFTFYCPTGQVLSGMGNELDAWESDRRWKFLCCKGEFLVNRNCSWSDYVNAFNGDLRWKASINHYLTGVLSITNSQTEDRRWRYYSCEK